MELSPANTDNKKTDVELARDLIASIASHAWNGKKDMIDRVYEAVAEKFPKSNWTRRRVRAIWHREAAGIQWHEMCQLIDVSEEASKAREQQKEARNEHRAYRAKTARIAALLERQDPDFHSPVLEGFRSLAG